jgi:hypothetical protein
MERKKFMKKRQSAFVVQRAWRKFVNEQRKRRYTKLEEQRQAIQKRQASNLERLKEL